MCVDVCTQNIFNEMNLSIFQSNIKISRNQYRYIYIYDHIFVLYRKAGTKAENRRNYSPPLKYHNKYFFKNPLNSQGFFTKLYYLYFLNQVMPLRKCMYYIRDMLHMQQQQSLNTRINGLKLTVNLKTQQQPSKPNCRNY